MSIHAINIRNQFRGRIKEIVLGPVVSEVDVDTAIGTVTSVITTRSVTELGLQVGTEAHERVRHAAGNVGGDAGVGSLKLRHVVEQQLVPFRAQRRKQPDEQRQSA